MPNIGKKFLLHFYVLNSFYMFWAQVVSRMHEFYVSTLRFCALIIEILWKFHVTAFFYWRYHSSSCIDICNCIIGWASFSIISDTFSASTKSKIMLWICRKGDSIVLQVSYALFRVGHRFIGLDCSFVWKLSHEIAVQSYKSMPDYIYIYMYIVRSIYINVYINIYIYV